MTTRFFDRAIRSSVDRAQKIQPRRMRRVADETLYSAPSQRGTVEDIRRATGFLLASGLGTRAGSVVAVRRNDRSVAMTRPDSDLEAVDGRSLETVTVESYGAHPVVRAAIDFGAAVWAHPVSLLALAAAGRSADRSLSKDLADRCGVLISGTSLEHPGVAVVTGEGVLAVGETAVDAVSRLEAAERLAAITLRTPDR